MGTDIRGLNLCDLLADKDEVRNGDTQDPGKWNHSLLPSLKCLFVSMTGFLMAKRFNCFLCKYDCMCSQITDTEKMNFLRGSK